MYAKALTYKSNLILIYLVKISIIAFSFYFIYSKLAHNIYLLTSTFWTILNSSAVMSLKFATEQTLGVDTVSLLLLTKWGTSLKYLSLHFHELFCYNF